MKYEIGSQIFVPRDSPSAISPPLQHRPGYGLGHNYTHTKQHSQITQTLKS